MSGSWHAGDRGPRSPAPSSWTSAPSLPSGCVERATPQLLSEAPHALSLKRIQVKYLAIPVVLY